MPIPATFTGSLSPRKQKSSASERGGAKLINSFLLLSGQLGEECNVTLLFLDGASQAVLVVKS